MGGPRVLLLDEPTQGLAPRIIDELAAKLLSIRAEGTAIVLAEPNPALARDIADRVVLLRGGRLVAAPEAEDLSGLYGFTGGRDT
jgi:branched-chain amino acid transport system ATP-binding protein